MPYTPIDLSPRLVAMNQTTANDIDRPASGATSPEASQAAWGSDAVADMLRSLDLEFIALTPGASFRGLHDSLVNHLGNTRPELLGRIIIATAVPEREIRREITEPVFKVHLKPFELPRLLADVQLCAAS